MPGQYVHIWKGAPGEASYWGQLLKLSSLSNPSKEVLLIDSPDSRFTGWGWHGVKDEAASSWSPGNPLAYYNWAKRHNGKKGSNILFADGHVAFYPDPQKAHSSGEIADAD